MACLLFCDPLSLDSVTQASAPHSCESVPSMISSCPTAGLRTLSVDWLVDNLNLTQRQNVLQLDTEH